MTELSESEARSEMQGMELPDLIVLAEGQGIAYAGVAKNDLIEMLLGKCAGCKKKG